MSDGIQINGRFERWVTSIIATLIALGVAALITLAIQVTRLAVKVDYITQSVIDIKTDDLESHHRLDVIERWIEREETRNPRQ